MNLSEIILKICEVSIDTLKFIMSELRAGNLLPALLLAVVVLIIADRKVLDVILVIVLLIILAKVVVK